MKDLKIVIDAGHGGDDPGASGNGIIEKELTLAISQYMYDLFKELGADVKMTRVSDETISPTERVNRILEAFGNNKDVIVISNHINAGGGDGAEVVYALRNTSELANLILDELEKSGQNIRKAYQRRLPSDTSKDYYFIHRNTGITEPVLVEYGFLDSTGDDVNQLKNNYKKYAQAVVDAVLEYRDLSTTPSSEYYTVKSGDSLWSIAKKYGISVDELKAANNLTSNVLQIGQRLNIPSMSGITTKPENYINYTVKSGDSLYSIASKNDLTVQELKNYNNLTSNVLQIGQILKIPVVSIEEVPIGKYSEYVVKSGDSLYSIGRKYGYTPQQLIDYNNLDSTILNVGQVLKIPTVSSDLEQTNYIEYTVKSGDNLYSIGRKYGVSPQELMNYNNLTSNLLSIGQTLKIPTSSSGTNTTYIEYKVKSGDNLYSIGRKYGYTAQELMNYNNLKSNLLSIGQTIRIPLSK